MNAERLQWLPTDLLLTRYREWRDLLAEVDDPYRPYDRSEWNGASRVEAGELLFRDILQMSDELQRRGVKPD